MLHDEFLLWDGRAGEIVHNYLEKKRVLPTRRLTNSAIRLDLSATHRGVIYLGYQEQGRSV